MPNETHDEYNADCFTFFSYRTRSQHAPMGGELSYYSAYDQEHALDPDGPYGVSFEQLTEQYHISYMIGNDQPDYQPMSRIEEAGMAIGYKFRITSFKASSSQSSVIVMNYGTAPIYADAYVTVNGVRSQQSLKGLQPGQSEAYTIDAGGSSSVLAIECDRLVAGQSIAYEADL